MNDYNSVQFLRKQFLCCMPLNKFIWPDFLKKINTDMQKQIISATVNNEIVFKYPMKQSYKKGFLKLFINQLEQVGLEIDDYVYNTYCNIVSSPDEQLLMHYRHFLLNNIVTTDLLSIKESTSIISQGTTGLCNWKAAFYLAEWCIIHKQEFKGKRVLELGSGVGLTGLTIINICAPKIYYFSDCHVLVLKTLEENVRLNLLKSKNTFLWKERIVNNRIQFKTANNDSNIKVNIINLKWEKIDTLITNEMDVDIIVAADVLYDKCSFKSLARGLKTLICNTVKYAIIAATVRNESTIEEFLKILVKYNLLYKEEIPLIPQIFLDYDDIPIRIFKISRKKSNS